MEGGSRKESSGPNRLRKLAAWTSKRDSAIPSHHSKHKKHGSDIEPAALDQGAIFTDGGLLKLSEADLQQTFGARGFDVNAFLNTHMRQLSPGALSTSKSEIDRLIESVHARILSSAVDNNEVYVQLCETAQSIEPSLQKLHSTLTTLRSLVRTLQSLESSWDEDSASVLSSRLEESSSFVGAPRDAGVPATPGALELADVSSKWRILTGHMDLAMAERRLHKVQQLLVAAQAVVDSALQRCLGADEGAGVAAFHVWLEEAEVYLQERRHAAIALLERSIMEPGCSKAESQQHVRLLSKLADSRHALNCMLASYRQEVETFLASTRERSGLEGDGFEVLGAISQRAFGAVGRAANDVSLIFKHEARDLSAPFTVWALRLTEHVAEYIADECIAKFAAALGLPAVLECVMAVMVYCGCLEDTHHVCLQPHLLRVLWPHLEPQIETHVQGAGAKVRAAAKKDVKESVAAGRCLFPSTGLAPSGALLLSEGKLFIDSMLCLEAVEAGRATRKASASLARAYFEGLREGVQEAVASGAAAKSAMEQMHGDIVASVRFLGDKTLTKALSVYAPKLGVLLVPAKLGPLVELVETALDVPAKQAAQHLSNES